MTNDMGIYAKLGAMLWRNGKARRFAEEHPRAFNTWVFALSYCTHLLSDGQLSDFDLRGILGASEEDVTALIDAGFLDVHDDGSVWVHDFVSAQGRSRADVEESKLSRSESARRAGRASAKARSQQKPNTATSFNDNATEVNGRSTESNDMATDVQRLSTDVQRTGNDFQRTFNDVATEPNGRSTDVQRISTTDTDTDTSKKEKTSFSQKKNRKTRIKPTFQLDHASIDHAKSLKLDPNRERNRFVDRWLADGGKCDDWQAMFRGWCDRSPDAKQPKLPSMPDEAWIQRFVLAWLDEDSQLPARRRFVQVFRESGDRDIAAQTVQAEFGGES